MLDPFATASRRTPPVLDCHSPGVATVTRHHCCTPPARRCPQQHRWQQQQRQQRVTEGTAMAPWNGPNNNANHCSYLLANILLMFTQHCWSSEALLAINSVSTMHVTITTKKNSNEFALKKCTNHTGKFPESLLFKNFTRNGSTGSVNIGDAAIHQKTDMCVRY